MQDGGDTLTGAVAVIDLPGHRFRDPESLGDEAVRFAAFVALPDVPA